MFNKKKKFFQEKLDGVHKMIWDFEFKRFKSLEIREEVRMQYDNLKSKIQMLDDRIKVEKEADKLTKDEMARLEDEKVILERDRDRYQAQMVQIDSDVHGVKASAGIEAMSGIDDQLESLQELKGMLKAYIKTL